MTDSLWGEEFNLEDTKEKTKKIIKKTTKKKAVSTVSVLDINKAIKSKNIDIEEKLKLVKDKVLEILGKQVNNTLVITNREELHFYLDKAIKYGRIAVDTETNNSIDPITCKLMGLCLYVKGEKQVYVPINHINRQTGERLKNQLNEKDIHEELNYIINKGCKFIFHNGKFDYKVLKCTCNVDMPIDWDTMVGAKMIDENEPSAGLKQQYIDKIDPNQAKYDIENLFEHLPYEIVDPEIFSLYSAADAMMTDRLYEWQIEKFKDPNLKGVLEVTTKIEIPIIKVVAKMELRGIDLDEEYSQRLAAKYHRLSEECNNKVYSELDKYKEKIEKWKLTSEANEKPKKEKIGKDGKEFGKSKREKLDDPIKLESPTQLAILLYDILKCPQVSLKQPRGTGVDQLTSLASKGKWPICEYLLEKRTIDKLLNTFIEALPSYRNPKDNKIHCEFLPLGTATGRFSSKQPNL